MDELLARIKLFLYNCRKLGIAISLKKLEIGQEITFAGFNISPEGVTPNSSKTKVISEFPRPRNLAEFRSFLGLANQLGAFTKNLAILTDTLRGLLHKGVAFKWSDNPERAFLKIRSTLSSPALVCCLLYTSPSPRDRQKRRMPSSA